MEPLAPGEVGEARPVPVAAPVGVQPSRPLPLNPRGFPPDGAPPTDKRGVTALRPGTPLSSLTGQLTIQVQPADAEVVVDGQSWPASPGQAAHSCWTSPKGGTWFRFASRVIRGGPDRGGGAARRDDYPERQSAVLSHSRPGQSISRCPAITAGALQLSPA